MTRSSRLKNILNKRKDLWNDSESDTSSSDTENKKILFKKSNDTSSDDDLSSSTCCLICSVLSNLSNINTCEKHLNLLTKPINRTQVVYMMNPAIDNCHCRSKSKRRYRSSSSSSSSLSDSRHHRKKRIMTVQSSDTESQSDLFFSPKIRSQENQPNHIQSPLSPSLPPSSTINTNKNYNELLLKPFLQRNNNETNSSDVIEIDSDLEYSPRISLNRIIHVKDEDEILNDNDQKKVTINMAEATKQMLNHEYPQPVILLQRICLEK